MTVLTITITIAVLAVSFVASVAVGKVIHAAWRDDEGTGPL